MSQRRVRRHAAGFTLTELMTVIVIVGIAAGLAMPGFGRALRKGRANAAARGVIDVFRYARAEALSRNRAMHVVIAPSASAAGGSISVAAGPQSVCTTLPIPGAPGTDTYTFQAGPAASGKSEAGDDTDIHDVTINGTAVAVADICMTPSGNLYQLGGGGTLTLIGTPILVTVGSYTSALANTKVVSIGPSGSARVL